MDDILEILKETQSQYTQSNKTKDKIIALLIVLMFLEAVIGYSGFVWYESQFEYMDTVTETTTDTHDIDLSTEGDNASIDYDNVEGNQYNDSTHNDNVEKEKTGGDE